MIRRISVGSIGVKLMAKTVTPMRPKGITLDSCATLRLSRVDTMQSSWPRQLRRIETGQTQYYEIWHGLTTYQGITIETP